MRLPLQLQNAIESELADLPAGMLARTSAQISEHYRSHSYSQPPLASREAKLAYLRVRLPATYAANLKAMQATQEVLGPTAISSMLDLGAGPGTAAWAAIEVFPGLERISFLERDSELVEIGRRLCFAGTNDALRSARWLQQDLACFDDTGKHDVVVLSYSLAELPEPVATQVVRRAWACTRHLLLIIEPGTPRHFEQINRTRNLLLEAGANLVAPCPHMLSCPMASAGDWCHFSARIERTAAHRQAKGAALGYEDEKFSYIAAARQQVHRPQARVVRHPLKRPGHVQLNLCRDGKLDRATIGKSQKVFYRSARKAEWGDCWDPEILAGQSSVE